MYSVTKAIGAVAATLLLLDASAQSAAFPDQRYRIKVALNGVPVSGSQELVSALGPAASNPSNPAYNTPSPTLTRNGTYQIQVTVTDPAGVTRDYTGSPLIRYEAILDCVAVSSLGTMTVTPTSGLCPRADSPTLWVVVTDTGGNPLAFNIISFNVIDGITGAIRARAPQDPPPPYPPPPLPTF